jgi:hypothetical protein
MKSQRPQGTPGVHNPELSAYLDAMQPVRDMLSRSVGSLSMEQVLLEQRRAERRTAKANLKLVRGLVSVLPHAKCMPNGNERLTCRTIEHAKAIQSNAVWWDGHFPSYLIGERLTDKATWLDIMLLDADGSSKPRIARVQKESFCKARDQASIALLTPYSVAELDVLGNRPATKFTVTKDTPGNMPPPIVQRTFSGILNSTPACVEVADGLSPDMMENFGVNMHLFELAEAFGVGAQLDGLYGSRDAIVSKLQS